MCGLIGIAARQGETPSLTDRQLARLRDRLIHRGPDSAGLWRSRNVALAHRRLVVIDPSPAAAQPFLSDPDPATGEPRFALVYNGELYNEPELRRELTSLGARFRTQSDTETILRAFEQWGTGALSRMRGIFAIALFDANLQTLTLARDPLGVKPLFYFRASREIMFSSEIGPLLRHPDAAVAPNPRMVSAYLTTIRTCLGGDTLIQGIHTLPPGHMLQCDLSAGVNRDGPPPHRLVEYWRGPRAAHAADHAEAVERVRSALEDSVTRQLRSDVPICCLLSGGLDSTIITAIAARHVESVRTYAAGAPIPADCGDHPADSDLHVARLAAQSLGTDHAEAHVTRGLFNDRWPWMVQQMGMPLSTPNEVAIYEVARRLRSDGCIVTLSGEGADELFAGYDRALDAAARFRDDHTDGRTAGAFELASNAWTPPDFKRVVLTPRAWPAADEDRWLSATYESEFTRAAAEAGHDGLDAHLRFHRRINLTGLLQRLDTATMLAGVEGRTPFADHLVAELAESLPLSFKFESDSAGAASDQAGHHAGSAVATLPRTKLILREAFSGVVPPMILERPKASFPVPFQSWVRDHTGVLRDSAFAREFLSDAAIAAVAQQPEKLWRLAWPMINLAYWGRSMGW
ncbi:MAG: asparagine synthase (glutamine-hydrolyzing) [Phycisphaerae bacterium]|nr:asparagine synthase (glutamine-hydrolyzing) [Phycisphaerae bacterium]